MEINDKRKELIVLLKTCPVHGDNPQDCPLYQIRYKKCVEQMFWLEQEVTADEVDRIFAHHKTCYIRKLLERY